MGHPPNTDENPHPHRHARPVLVVGTDDWAVEQVISRLEATGTPTLTCHPPGQPAFPCNALVEGRTCPLDVGFDVVVTVRARPVDPPEFGEFGVVCGLRAGARLVTAGISGRDPFAPWTTASVGRDDGIATIVAEVAASRVAVTDLTDEQLVDVTRSSEASDPRAV